MGDVLALVFRLVLAAVFAVAAAAKLRDRFGTSEALKSFGVPEKMAPAGVYLLPAAEGLAAVLLVATATSVAGAVWSIALLATFTGAVALNLARGKRPPCRCFGEMSATPIGARTVVRNITLAALALYVIVLAPSTFADARGWIASPTLEAAELWAAISLLAIGLCVQAWHLVRLRDTTEALRARLESLEKGTRLALPVGSKAPSFELPTTDGTTTGLTELLAIGKPVILTFTDPHCGPCQALVPQLSMWQASLRNVFTVGVISRGEMGDSERHAAETGLSGVMVQQADEVAEAFGSGGTPSAVRIAPNGTVDSDLASGVDQIQGLFEATITAHARSLWQQATGEEVPRPFVGLPLGTEPPDLMVTDLSGVQHHLPILLERSTMLVFWSPRCGFCHQMVDDMRSIEQRLPADRHIVYVTVGTAEENRHLGLTSLMLSDEDWEIGETFKASGTPAAVLLQEGKISSQVESGIDGVLSLAREFVGPGPQRVETPFLRRN